MPPPADRPWSRTVAAGLFALFAGLAAWGVLENSVTVDEPVYLVRGYTAWRTGALELGLINPPLAPLVCALPYLALRPALPPPPTGGRRLSFEMGREFLFHNRYSADALLTAGRLPVLVLGLALLALIWRWSASLWGERGGMLSLGLAALCPNLIAHASLATSDILISVTTVGAVWLLARAVAAPSAGRWAAAGAVLGAAIATKFTALALLPAAAALAWVARDRRGGLFNPAGGTERPAHPLRHAVAGVGAFLGVIVMAYGVWHMGLLFQGVGQAFHHARAGQGGSLGTGLRSVVVVASAGLVAMLMKLPIPTMALLAAAGVLWARQRGWRRPEEWDVLLPAALMFLGILWTRLQIGFRYALPAYALLLVWIGHAARWPFWRTGAGRVVAGLGAVWLVAGTVRTGSRQLAYVNEFAGMTGRVPWWLVSSNLDWGQDLKRLKRVLDGVGPHDLVLSYYGSADPSDYGILYQGLMPVSVAMLQALKLGAGPVAVPAGRLHAHRAPRELLAVSASNLKGHHFRDRTLFWWLWGRTPLSVTGGAIYVYDITGDVEAHEHLVRIYQEQGSPDEEREEAAWLARLRRPSPVHPLP